MFKGIKIFFKINDVSANVDICLETYKPMLNVSKFMDLPLPVASQEKCRVATLETT